MDFGGFMDHFIKPEDAAQLDNTGKLKSLKATNWIGAEK